LLEVLEVPVLLVKLTIKTKRNASPSVKMGSNMTQIQLSLAVEIHAIQMLDTSLTMTKNVSHANLIKPGMYSLNSV
jgi:hypothetical protein